MTPTTEAGLALAAEYRRWFTEQGWEAEGWDPLGSEANLTRDILAIEAEARAEGPDCCDWQHEWPCPTIPRCDEPGCERMATCGWPTRPGGTGPNGGYRRTCGEHMDMLAAYRAVIDRSEP